MTLPQSGSISMSQIAAEIGLSKSGMNLNHSEVRKIAFISSGTISMNDLHGKKYDLSPVGRGINLSGVPSTINGVTHPKTRQYGAAYIIDEYDHVISGNGQLLEEISPRWTIADRASYDIRLLLISGSGTKDPSGASNHNIWFPMAAIANTGDSYSFDGEDTTVKIQFRKANYPSFVVAEKQVYYARR